MSKKGIATTIQIHDICVSKDVVFYELKSWYGTLKCLDVEGENDKATVKALKQK